MKRMSGFARPPIDQTALPRDEDEELSFMFGQMAMMQLDMVDKSDPDRLKIFHQLREAARRDPFAAYNLGNLFSPLSRGRDILDQTKAARTVTETVRKGRPYGNGAPQESG